MQLGMWIGSATMAWGVYARITAAKSVSPTMDPLERESRDGGGGTLIVLGALIVGGSALAKRMT